MPAKVRNTLSRMPGSKLISGMNRPGATANKSVSVTDPDNFRRDPRLVRGLRLGSTDNADFDVGSENHHQPKAPAATITPGVTKNPPIASNTMAAVTASTTSGTPLTDLRPIFHAAA